MSRMPQAMLWAVALLLPGMLAQAGGSPPVSSLSAPSAAENLLASVTADDVAQPYAQLVVTGRLFEHDGRMRIHARATRPALDVVIPVAASRSPQTGLLNPVALNAAIGRQVCLRGRLIIEPHSRTGDADSPAAEHSAIPFPHEVPRDAIDAGTAMSGNRLSLHVTSVEVLETRSETVIDRITVIARGQLFAGLYAIGGETTGSEIQWAESPVNPWELELPDHMADSVTDHDQQPVVISGDLRVLPGVAVGPRWIVTVRSLLLEP